MATLSGQTIQSTYQGLLKLADSSTGITSNLQSVQDGLGNETPIRVSTNRLNINNFYSYQNLKPRYTGNGYSAVNGAQQASGVQNILFTYPFYDTGIYSYSAMTYRVGTITSTSDVVEIAFYTPQIGEFGLFPHQRVGSVQTLSGLTSAAEHTIPFSGGNISFSGTGSGLYFAMLKYSNAGVQPTVRFNTQVTTITSAGLFESSTFGYAPVIGSNGYNGLCRFTGNRLVFSGASTFDSSFLYSTISSAQSLSAAIAGGLTGFLLHVNNY